ncbi:MULTISPECIES: SCO family protein [Halomonadaceae]|uniref:SCO family protein n=1 Tax=Halomonadaceae TaxID=28256 RepID=UPI0015996217|nr:MULTISPECIES: SCO family protein [Halomonas]QJQ95724.1 SCO family protein [Halomonas sp. PA5]
MARRGRYVLGAAGTLVLMSIALGLAAVRGSSPEVTGAPASADPPSLILDFTLVSHRGETLTPDAFEGRWLLLFFGFTHCPDVCPASLATLAQVLERLGDQAEPLQPLMISVDPKRDTPDILSRYVTHFHHDIVGLTGTPAQVDAAAASLRAYYRQVPYGSQGDYTVDHSAFFYLIDPQREVAELYPHGMGVEAIADDIRAHLDAAPSWGGDT